MRAAAAAVHTRGAVGTAHTTGPGGVVVLEGAAKLLRHLSEPRCSCSRWLRRVVLPAPRKPVRMVTGMGPPLSLPVVNSLSAIDAIVYEDSVLVYVVLCSNDYSSLYCVTLVLYAFWYTVADKGMMGELHDRICKIYEIYFIYLFDESIIYFLYF